MSYTLLVSWSYGQTDLLEKYRYYDQYGYFETGINNNVINQILLDLEKIWVASSGGIKIFTTLISRELARI
jgi:hypothetical protein